MSVSAPPTDSSVGALRHWCEGRPRPLGVTSSATAITFAKAVTVPPVKAPATVPGPIHLTFTYYSAALTNATKQALALLAKMLVPGASVTLVGYAQKDIPLAAESPRRGVVRVLAREGARSGTDQYSLATTVCQRDDDGRLVRGFVHEIVVA